MQTYSCQKMLLLLTLLCSILSFSTNAQTPEYTFTNGTSSNAIPLGTGTSWEPYMSQFLYLPGDFAPAVPTNAVRIKTIYFKVGSTSVATTYNDFEVYIGNTSQTAMTTTFVTGLTLALSASTMSFPAATSGVWLKIDLTTPVVVDLTQPLVVDIRHGLKVGGVGGYSLLSGGAPVNPAYTGNTQTYFKSTTATTGTTRRYSYQFGIDIISCDANVTQQPVDVSVCSSSTAVFNASAVQHTNYQWQVDNGTGWVNLGTDAIYSGVTTPTLTVRNTTPAMNNYRYRILAIDQPNNCQAESDPAKLIMVPSSNSSVVIAADPGNVVCPKEEVVFTSAFTKGGATPQYRWLLNGLEIPGAIAATLKMDTLDHGDIVKCRFISSELCVFESVSPGVTVSVVSSLLAEVGISTTYNGGNSYTFIADPKNGGASPRYYWYVNGKLQVGETGQSFTTETLAPWDKVTVGMFTSRECAEPKLATSRQATTGVVDVENGAVKVVLSPNPNRGIFTLQASNLGAGNVRLAVVNALGQKMYTAHVELLGGELQHQVDLDGKLAPGLYMINIELNGKSEVRKFTVSE